MPSRPPYLLENMAADAVTKYATINYQNPQNPYHTQNIPSGAYMYRPKPHTSEIKAPIRQLLPPTHFNTQIKHLEGGPGTSDFPNRNFATRLPDPNPYQKNNNTIRNLAANRKHIPGPTTETTPVHHTNK